MPASCQPRDIFLLSRDVFLHPPDYRGCPILARQFHRATGRVPGERLLLAGVERGVSFAVANDRLSFLSRALSL